MAYDEGLAQRVRETLGARPGITERRMFGGLAFLVDGKMFVGISGSRLMARVGTDRYADALALPNQEEDKELAAWVSWCASHAASLPAKASR
jgi:TfoX/Sxy family transcriptional regulator of competence genes